MIQQNSATDLNNTSPGTTPTLVCFGECMIELRQSSPDDQDTLNLGFSGDTLNTATYLARLAQGQYRTFYATALGDDSAYSGRMIARWQAEGIETALVSRLPGQLPGLYTIRVDTSGERQFFYWRNEAAARSYFSTPTTPLEDQAAQIDVFYASGISLAILPAEGRARLLALMQHLRRSGKTLIFDNNFRPRLWASRQQANDAFGAALACATIALLTLSDEAARLDCSEAAALEAARALPCPELVIKRGAEPTLIRHAGAETEVPTLKVARVVDTTAAGDSFAAGYCAARLHGQSPQQAASAGNRLAATVIQHPGAIIPLAAMPS